MKAKILIALFIFSGLVSCNSQESEIGKNKRGKSNKPHEEYSVNRKYDKNGNLIEFDSTYTSYYSDFEGDTVAMDSLMNQFSPFFNDQFTFQFPSHFETPDSGFFHDNFFEHQFFTQDEMLLKLMQRMDSLKNEFFKDFPQEHF